MNKSWKVKQALFVCCSLLALSLHSPASAATKSITCYKGSAVKIVKGSNPKCPAGFSIKKPVLTSPTPSAQPQPIPTPVLPLMSAEFIDLKHLTAISKFRSCVGHDFSPGEGGHGPPGSESGRSMKHYLQTDLPLSPGNSVKIFAPSGGSIQIEEETFPLGKQVYINSGEWSVRIFHIDPIVKNGDVVKAGDLIGTIPPINAQELLGHPGPTGQKPYQFDIAVSKSKLEFKSIFEIMTPQIASEWAQKGFTKENSFLSKEFRDATPCTLRPDGQFFANSDGGPDDWVPSK